MAGSSTETFPTSADGVYVVGNIRVEEEVDMQEEREVNVKTENVIISEEEECIDIKDEECIYSEVEDYIDTKEEEDVNIKEEVS
jgi:hypothetical protein